MFRAKISDGFNAGRGYGFITQPGGADLFVHFTNIAADGYKTLGEGAVVSYRVGEGRSVMVQ